MSAWRNSSKQIGQRSCSERAAGKILPFPHLVGVLERSAVDDLGSVSPPVEPGVQPAQGRFPLNAPLGPLARRRVLGRRVQESQRVEVSWKDSGEAPPAASSANATGAALPVWLRSRRGNHSFLLQTGGQRGRQVLDGSPPAVVSSLGVCLPVRQQHADHLSIKSMSDAFWRWNHTQFNHQHLTPRRPTWLCPCMAARCRGVYPALDLIFKLTGMAFSLAKASSWDSSSALPCFAAQWRQVKPVTKSLLVTSPGSTARRGCRLSHRPSEAHSIHSCSSGSRVTEAQSSSVAEERRDIESPSPFTESRTREPRLIRDLRTCTGQNVKPFVERPG